MEYNTKFFIIHPCSNMGEISVIDLSDAVSYMLDDWCTAVTREFYTAESACRYARALAKKYDLDYIQFDSRYGDDYDDSDPEDSDDGKGLHLTEEEELAAGVHDGH